MEITKEIIESVQQGDRKMILALYQHSFQVLMGNAVRYKKNSEDQMQIVNNAFMKIISNIHHFQPGTAYFSWIKQIVKREIIDDFRKNKRYKELFEMDVISSTPVENETMPEIDQQVEAEYLNQILDTLPPATKLVFNLYAIDGFTSKEIAADLSISYETVKWHIKEARRKLRFVLWENQILK